MQSAIGVRECEAVQLRDVGEKEGKKRLSRHLLQEADISYPDRGAKWQSPDSLRILHGLKYSWCSFWRPQAMWYVGSLFTRAPLVSFQSLPSPCTHNNRRWNEVFNAEGGKFTHGADSFLSVIGVGCLWRSSGVWLISAAGYNKQYAAISVDVCVVCRTWEAGGEIWSCVVVLPAVSPLFPLSTCACWTYITANGM